VKFPVRYRILGLLFVLSFVNYFLRNNFSVVVPGIREEFHFSNEEIGWILGSFNFAYALFQIPGGVFGDVVGPRRALTLIAITWGVLTALTGFAPALLAASATGALVSLMAVRFLMGIANAPMYPVAAGAFEKWFPVGGWAMPNAMLSAGLTLGQAAVGPIVTSTRWRRLASSPASGGTGTRATRRASIAPRPRRRSRSSMPAATRRRVPRHLAGAPCSCNATCCCSPAAISA
jgi:MFS family permease